MDLSCIRLLVFPGSLRLWRKVKLPKYLIQVFMASLKMPKY